MIRRRRRKPASAEYVFQHSIDLFSGVGFNLQETGGVVTYAYNTKFDLGRRLNTLTYAAYTAGAGWSNSGGQVALHTAGNTATLAHTAAVLAVGKTYALTTVITGRTAGTVTPTGGTAISATTVGQAITASGTALVYTPTTDFDGSLDLALVVLKQTNILASSVYPGAELLGNPGNPFTFTADVLDDYTNSADDANHEIGEVAQGQAHADIGTPGGGYVNIWRSGGASTTFLQRNTFTVGLRYRIETVIDTVASGSLVVQDSGSGIAATYTAAGVYILEGVTSGVNLQVFTGADPTDITVKSISITLANPLNGDVTGATPGTKGGGPIRYMWSFDGAAALINRLSAEYNSLQSPLAFTKSVAIRKATWDTTERYILHDYIDADNWDAIYTSTTQDQVVFEHRAGGTTEQITWDSLGATDIIVLDIGVGSTTFKARVNGVNVGSESVAGTQIGNLTVALIGAATITTKVHLGDAAYAENVNTYVPDAEMLRIVRSLIG